MSSGREICSKLDTFTRRKKDWELLGIFEIAGLLTHLLVLALGVGGMIGWIPLVRGRRAGVGLLLMAVSMGLIMLEPSWQLGIFGAVAYTITFLTALWLLLGPDQRKP